VTPRIADPDTTPGLKRAPRSGHDLVTVLRHADAPHPPLEVDRHTVSRIVNRAEADEQRFTNAD
jgi:hypothetical protein